ncbi:hypothetical protein ACFL0L_00140 [Patescibacteria group bacterium]
MQDDLRLEKAILKTLAYFDMFDYPLTAQEIWKWLYGDQSCSYSDILDVLKKVRDKIEFKSGYFFLEGRSNLVDIRQSRYRVAEKKFQKAITLAKVLRYLPFIRMVAGCNKLGYNNNAAESDIDLFFIVQKNRLWITRFFITGIAQVLGLRRYGTKITDRVCLSFYVTTDRLSIRDLSKKPTDPYLVYWIAHLYPLTGYEWYQKFIEANRWIKDFLPNIEFVIPSPRRAVHESEFSKIIKKVFEVILFGPAGSALNALVRLYQMKKIKKHHASKLWDDSTDVLVGDEILKFHEKDRRDQFREQFEEKCAHVTS